MSIDLSAFSACSASPNTEKTAIVKALRPQFPLEMLLGLVGLKRSAFFYHLAEKEDKMRQLRKRYLSPIKDLFNGEIIAYDVAKHPNIEQITRMMQQAIARLDGATPILHSDQGWQYQMASYRELCQT